MINEAKLQEYYGKIANELNAMIPCEWERVVLYAEDDGQGSYAEFYFFTEDGETIAGGFIIDKFDVDEDEYDEHLENLWDINSELRDEFIDAGEKPWCTYTFDLYSDGSFKMDFGYELNEKLTSMVRELRWAYDKLGIIPTASYEKKFLRDYFIEQGKELIPELIEEDVPEKIEEKPQVQKPTGPIINILTEKEIEYRNKVRNTILSNPELKEQVMMLCCMEFNDELIPLDDIAEGFKFSMDGQVFAEDGGGGHYLFLEDGTIGYVNFAENESGRVANTLKEMLELEANCAYGWHNYATTRYVNDPEHLRKFVYGLEMDGRFDYEDAFGEDAPEYDDLLKVLSEALDFKIYENIIDDVIIPFYNTTVKEIEFFTTGDEQLGGLIH